MSSGNIVCRRGNTIGFQTRSGEILYYEYAPSDAASIEFGNDPKGYSGTRVSEPNMTDGIEGIAIAGAE